MRNEFVKLPVENSENNTPYIWVNAWEVVRIIPHAHKCTLTFTNGREVTINMHADSVALALK